MMKGGDTETKKNQTLAFSITGFIRFEFSKLVLELIQNEYYGKSF